MASPISSDTLPCTIDQYPASPSREADSQSLEILQIRVSDMLFTFLDIHFSLALSGLCFSDMVRNSLIDDR